MAGALHPIFRLRNDPLLSEQGVYFNMGIAIIRYREFQLREKAHKNAARYRQGGDYGVKKCKEKRFKPKTAIAGMAKKGK